MSRISQLVSPDSRRASEAVPDQDHRTGSSGTKRKRSPKGNDKHLPSSPVESRKRKRARVTNTFDKNPRGSPGNNDGTSKGALESEGIRDWEEDGSDDAMRSVLSEIKKISHEYKRITGFLPGDCSKLSDGEESGVYTTKRRDGSEFKSTPPVFDLLRDLQAEVEGPLNNTGYYLNKPMRVVTPYSSGVSHHCDSGTQSTYASLGPNRFLGSVFRPFRCIKSMTFGVSEISKIHKNVINFSSYSIQKLTCNRRGGIDSQIDTMDGRIVYEVSLPDFYSFLDHVLLRDEFVGKENSCSVLKSDYKNHLTQTYVGTKEYRKTGGYQKRCALWTDSSVKNLDEIMKKRHGPDEKYTMTNVLEFLFDESVREIFSEGARLTRDKVLKANEKPIPEGAYLRFSFWHFLTFTATMATVRGEISVVASLLGILWRRMNRLSSVVHPWVESGEMSDYLRLGLKENPTKEEWFGWDMIAGMTEMILFETWTSAAVANFQIDPTQIRSTSCILFHTLLCSFQELPKRYENYHSAQSTIRNTVLYYHQEAESSEYKYMY